jgi:hypothetical protein
MEFIETVCNKVDVAVKAIKDSDVSDILVFRNRNESPLLYKENALPVLKGSHLCYSVDDAEFYESSESESEFLKMDDIILAELVDASGLGVCDMSHFLHSVKWESNSPPSVYELVLVNTLLSKICLSKQFLATCVLNVTTLENPLVCVKLNNPSVRDDFLSWNVFLPPSSPRGAPAPETSAPVAVASLSSAPQACETSALPVAPVAPVAPVTPETSALPLVPETSALPLVPETSEEPLST